MKFNPRLDFFYFMSHVTLSWIHSSYISFGIEDVLSISCLRRYSPDEVPLGIVTESGLPLAMFSWPGYLPFSSPFSSILLKETLEASALEQDPPHLP